MVGDQCTRQQTSKGLDDGLKWLMLGEPAAPMSVDRICTTVVLPARLGPSSEKIVPSTKFRSILSSTTLLP